MQPPHGMNPGWERGGGRLAPSRFKGRMWNEEPERPTFGDGVSQSAQKGSWPSDIPVLVGDIVKFIAENTDLALRRASAQFVEIYDLRSLFPPPMKRQREKAAGEPRPCHIAPGHLAKINDPMGRLVDKV